MAARVVTAGVFVVFFAIRMDPGLAQSKIPGAPSNAPPRVTDVTDGAEAIGDRAQAFFDNLSLLDNYMRQGKIESRLRDYLNQIGAKPTLGEVHIFYVQVLTDDNGSVELKDFQYLTYGTTAEAALRESFTLEHAPGTEDRLYAVPNGTRLVGIYVTATPEDGSFTIRGETLSKEYYQRVRQEGLALRDRRAKERTEAQRIEGIRQQRAATQAFSDPFAYLQLKRDTAIGPLPPGPALFPPGPPPDRNPYIYTSPTQVRSPPATVPSPSSATPPVPFTPPSPSPPIPSSSPSGGPAIGGPT